MTLPVDVTLPKSQKPIFPDRCVACGTANPRAELRFGTHAIGWWTIVLLSFGGRFSVRVPTCDRCRARVLRNRWLRIAVTIALAVAGLLVARELLGSYEGPLRKWIAVGIALLCMTPLLLWQLFFPPPLDLTATSSTVEYEFRDRDYAAEFARLNQPADEQ